MVTILEDIIRMYSQLTERQQRKLWQTAEDMIDENMSSATSEPEKKVAETLDFPAKIC